MEPVLAEQFFLGCLAHASCLIGSEGIAAVIDPQRDVREPGEIAVGAKGKLVADSIGAVACAHRLAGINLKAVRCYPLKDT